MSFDRSVALGDLLEVQNGYAFKSADFNNEGRGTPLIRIRDLQGSKTETFFDGEYRDEFMVSRGDLLIGMDGDFRCVAWEGPPGLLNQRVCRLRNFSDEVLPEYVFFSLGERLDEIHRNTAFATVKHISSKQIQSIQIPLPPLEEQRRIVDILNRAASIERLRARASTQLRALIPALFIKMFGDPITNPMGWEVMSLGDVTTLVQYGTSKKASETGDGVPVLRMGNVSYDGHLDCTDLKYVELEPKEVAKFQLQAGDILFNRTNSRDLVGKTGVWDGRFDAVPASYFIQVRLDLHKVVPTYVGAFMNTAQLKRVLFQMAKGAIGQANINAKELQSIQIPVPPLDLQQRYADVINRIQDMIFLLDRSSEEARALSQALMAQLFGSKNLGKTSGETLEPRLTETAVAQ